MSSVGSGRRCLSAAPVRSRLPFQRVPSDRYSTDVRFGDGPDGRRQIGGPPEGAALAHQGAPRPAGAAASLLTGRALDSDLGGDDREQDLLAERADACRYAAPARQVAAMTRARPGSTGDQPSRRTARAIAFRAKDSYKVRRPRDPDVANSIVSSATPERAKHSPAAAFRGARFCPIAAARLTAPTPDCVAALLKTDMPVAAIPLLPGRFRQRGVGSVDYRSDGRRPAPAAAAFLRKQHGEGAPLSPRRVDPRTAGAMQHSAMRDEMTPSRSTGESR